MPHARELRQVKDINYNILDAVRKPDESGLTPLGSRRLKTESLDADTIKEKK